MNQSEGHSQHRKDSLKMVVGPSWLFLPDLRLLIGDGYGVVGCIKEASKRIDTWVFFEKSVVSDVELYGKLCDDYIGRRVPIGLPSPTLITSDRPLSDRPQKTITEGNRGGRHLAPRYPCRSAVITKLVIDEISGVVELGRSIKVPPTLTLRLSELACDEYRVTCAIDHEDYNNQATLFRRKRSLKLEYRQKMEELGIPYEPGAGVGRRPKKPVGGKRPLRPENEHAFTVWVSEKKDGYIKDRRRELIDDATTRPANFHDLMNSAKRSRDAEVARGKLDGNGIPHVPLTERELIERAAGMVARGEATSLMFDIRYEPALTYDVSGRITVF
jgi:hypothetical protein